MIYSQSDFIGVYEEAYSSTFCEDAIAMFEWAKTSGLILRRNQLEPGMDKVRKDDECVFAFEFDMMHSKKHITKTFIDVFWSQIYPKYNDDFEAALSGSSGAHTMYTVKAQKTLPGQGYHVWHYEGATRETAHRLLTWILYLNDVEEGGETEFLYYRRRIKPKQGTFVLFPGALTHTHRGNPPLSGEKYILTGLVEF